MGEDYKLGNIVRIANQRLDNKWIKADAVTQGAEQFYLDRLQQSISNSTDD